MVRPDIAYTISKLSRYISKPRADHWEGIVRIIRYLRYTSSYWLHYTWYLVVIEGYHDAN